eukprot:Gb_41220 [translate_table: standard]
MREKNGILLVGTGAVLGSCVTLALLKLLFRSAVAGCLVFVQLHLPLSISNILEPRNNQPILRNKGTIAFYPYTPTFLRLILWVGFLAEKFNPSKFSNSSCMCNCCRLELRVGYATLVGAAI